MRKRPPCSVNCEKRTVNCHIYCQEYKDWKKELEKEKEARQQEYDKIRNPKRSKRNMKILMRIK